MLFFFLFLQSFAQFQYLYIYICDISHCCCISIYIVVNIIFIGDIYRSYPVLRRCKCISFHVTVAISWECYMNKNEQVPTNIVGVIDLLTKFLNLYEFNMCFIFWCKKTSSVAELKSCLIGIYNFNTIHNTNSLAPITPPLNKYWCLLNLRDINLFFQIWPPHLYIKNVMCCSICDIYIYNRSNSLT